MKTITRYDIKECSIEFHVRTWRDINKIFPFAAEFFDPNPVIVASFYDEKEACAFLDAQESYVRFFSYAGMTYCRFGEYILEENVYSVDEYGDEEWMETQSFDCSRMPESITFGCNNYAWNYACKRWIEIEEEEEEEEEEVTESVNTSALYKILQFGREQQHDFIVDGKFQAAYNIEHARNQMHYALLDGVDAVRELLPKMTQYTIGSDGYREYNAHFVSDDYTRKLVEDFAKTF